MNIVLNQHNILSSNTIKVKNRIGNKIISTDKIRFKEVNMNGAIHSIKLENKYFTNFVKSYDKKLYIEIKELFDDIILKNATLDEKFILLNNDNQNEEKEKRLQEIIKENLNIEKIPSLMEGHEKDIKNTIENPTLVYKAERFPEKRKHFVRRTNKKEISSYNNVIVEYDTEQSGHVKTSYYSEDLGGGGEYVYLNFGNKL